MLLRVSWLISLVDRIRCLGGRRRRGLLIGRPFAFMLPFIWRYADLAVIVLWGMSRGSLLGILR